MLTALIAGTSSSRLPADEASEAANLHWQQYLQRNVVASETLHSMQDFIRQFRHYAPRLFASKCIDGRVHGSNAKGYPPTTCTFSRTDGNRVELTPENSYFWNRLNSVVLDARRHTPDAPALFIALGHFAVQGSGCAAHGGNTEAALVEVADQAAKIRRFYNPTDLYVVHGMTNTDDSAERIIFEDGRELDTAAIIDRLDTPQHPLRSPVDVFQQEFLQRPMDDPPTSRYVGDRRPAELVERPMFHELQPRIALEVYFLREVTQIVRNGTRNNVVFAPRVFDEVRRILDSVRGLPDFLKAPFLHQTLWNIGSTLHERQLLPQLSPVERRLRQEHGEVKVAYGEGFEIERRNRLVLAKPGRGDDQKALQVARNVLLNNRKHAPQPHPPLVHVTHEIAGEPNTWTAFNREVLSVLKTRIDNVRTVFGDDCRILATYSRFHEKCFYPVRIEVNRHRDPGADADPVMCFPVDVTRDLADDNFDREHLSLREQVYRQMMALEAERAAHVAAKT
jgi:hypothetical protein